MSNEEQKIRHSKRRQNTQKAIKKQTKIAKQFLLDLTEPHRFAKQHALDCGISKCPLCSSPRKTKKQRTIQEKSFYQTKLLRTEFLSL